MEHGPGLGPSVLGNGPHEKQLTILSVRGCINSERRYGMEADARDVDAQPVSGRPSKPMLTADGGGLT